MSRHIMNTHATVTIDIVLDRQNTREILCALLHAILFHCLFGTIKPQTFEKGLTMGSQVALSPDSNRPHWNPYLPEFYTRFLQESQVES
ncbi:hypothetical protein BC827DRAFT_528768 [Russula dissimulans]|nr:hypothetical protein BC827DRAFT_528768 [Russula dissimulans]